jgi:hypothetical protein
MGVTALAQAIDKSADRQKNLRDANLVNLFIKYLSKTERLTEEGTENFERFDSYVSRMVISAVAWDNEADDAVPSNKFIFPDDPGNHIVTPHCPGACCCSTGLRSCGSWYPIVAFI